MIEDLNIDENLDIIMSSFDIYFDDFGLFRYNLKWSQEYIFFEYPFRTDFFNNIDYYETILTFSLHPNEDEITIIDDKKVKIVNIFKY